MADNSDNAGTFRYDKLLYGAVSMNSSAKPQKYGFIHYGGFVQVLVQVQLSCPSLEMEWMYLKKKVTGFEEFT